LCERPIRNNPVLKFLHLADLHLGAAPSYLGDLAQDRANDYLDAFKRCVDYAVDQSHEINVVLIVGDFFDVANPAQDVVRFTIDNLKRLAQARIPVIVTPGNHDGIGAPETIYRNTKFCELIRVIRSPQVEYFDSMVINGEVVHFYGMAWDKQSKPPFDTFHKKDENGYHIALIHGTLRDGLFSEAHSREVPLELANLAKSGMDYIALGHLHKFQKLEAGKIPVVYPGTLESRRFSPGEEGDRYLVIVSLDRSQKAIVNQLKWNKKSVVSVQLDLDRELVETEDELAELIHSKYASKNSLLRITLSGAPPFIVDEEEVMTRLSGDCYWLNILDNTSAFNSILAETWQREETIRGLYVRKLKEKLETADLKEEKQKYQLAMKLATRAFQDSSRRQ
jgi:DNA repair protein SbcD/Mre11